MATVVSDKTSYQYRPLQYEDEIRLVRILPASTFEREICCEIIHHRKSSRNLEYDAISYVWGDPSNLKPIKISPELSEFSITSNCFDALRRLRHQQEPRLVWVDALCINQSDNEEKIRQVRNMGEIYALSEKVIAYLGDADDASNLVFSYWRDNYDLFTRYRTRDHNWPGAVVEAGKALLKRPWFSRVWVLQEVFYGSESAKSGVHAVCGNDQIDWDILASACKVFCTPNSEFFVAPNPPVPYVLTVGSGKEKKSIIEILCETRSSNATDPRDKLFGVLSLVEEHEQENAQKLASYDQTTTMVYTEIGLYLLSNYHLSILQPIRHPHDSFPGLASWIPDWSRTDTNDPFMLDLPERSFFEKRSFVPEARVLECCRENSPGSDHLFHPVLPVTGFRLSQIISLGAIFDFESSRQQCYDAVNQMIDAEGHCKENPHLPPTFVPGCIFRKEFRRLFAAGFVHDELDSTLFYEGVLHRCRLFVDDTNCLGVAPLEAEIGDYVCALAGAMKLCILRGRSDGGWTLISGECYTQWHIWASDERTGEFDDSLPTDREHETFMIF